MHGMGNDFVVIDSYTHKISLNHHQIIKMANRRTGIGADQILIVEKSDLDNCDFKYRIFNADGSEVEHCGNGARCFMLYVFEKKLTIKQKINVEIMKGIITLKLLDNNIVEVNMGKPKLDAVSVDFDENNDSVTITNIKTKILTKDNTNLCYKIYEINENDIDKNYSAKFTVVSMGNPHAVQIVDDIDSFNAENQGKWLESHHLFKNRVNAGFMQVLNKNNIKIRVYERGAGETMACGTGACAAVVSGIVCGLLESPVTVQTQGGNLNICWSGNLNDDIIMQGNATKVFDGIINI